MASIGVITKQPSERFPVAIAYANRLPAGCALASGTAAAVQLDTDEDVTDTLLGSDAVTIDGTDAIVEVQAGSDGVNYQVTVLVQLDQGSPAYVLEDDFLVQVRAT